MSIVIAKPTPTGLPTIHRSLNHEFNNSNNDNRSMIMHLSEKPLEFLFRVAKTCVISSYGTESMRNSMPIYDHCYPDAR